MQHGNMADDVAARQARPVRPLALLLPFLATLQLICFYILRVPSYLMYDSYEHGAERMPFQGRMLMQYPLLWAHRSALLIRTAGWLTATRTWSPCTILPENILEVIVDVVAVSVAGVVAMKLYRLRSRQARLLAWVYPVFLALVAMFYCLIPVSFYRYIYDLPSLGLFAAGLYFIYCDEQVLLFALTFIVVTVNRETSLFLLFLFVQHGCSAGSRFHWRRMATVRVGGVAAVLGLFWAGFQHWLTLRFGVPHSGMKPGAAVNFLLLLWPFAWPQLAAFALPLLLISRWRRGPSGAPLYAWMWVLPLWAVCMFAYGSIVEIRLFGEFLPLLASTMVATFELQLFEGTS